MRDHELGAREREQGWSDVRMKRQVGLREQATLGFVLIATGRQKNALGRTMANVLMISLDSRGDHKEGNQLGSLCRSPGDRRCR